ncbi:hypothetical protein HanRHA438_Chr07g0300801 [Helianthus annuus]|uniref:Uncharacterized protein n=1 Tax=Helianthus annuus TaxID=4232 RepID=A0A251UA15_HELAN|nr:hypothetical protein HanXRQr2_Chr07g0290291 [Helianthus annuus]KAJ0549853.1 hypothetical protein HanHA300_Chr07g0238701 [Helianthus annuus]KAJ0556383.1 hypothetical protein HanIR_Chr07g0313151 [Helianthus annuus]KAJ0562811.1 hypothetical protein HanHA89_Chr07g0255911 [Helianthus annuus]KAJ0730952.1 hypothetical protein HanOQP8_Chr07g0246311 [Helianthus annuus]
MGQAKEDLIGLHRLEGNRNQTSRRFLSIATEELSWRRMVEEAGDGLQGHRESVRWMIRRSSQSKIMMGPTGLGHKVPTKLVQVKGNILESGRLVCVRTDSVLSGFGPNWIRVKSKYFKKWWFT